MLYSLLGCPRTEQGHLEFPRLQKDGSPKVSRFGTLATRNPIYYVLVCTVVRTLYYVLTWKDSRVYYSVPYYGVPTSITGTAGSVPSRGVPLPCIALPCVPVEKSQHAPAKLRCAKDAL